MHSKYYHLSSSLCSSQCEKQPKYLCFVQPHIGQRSFLLTSLLIVSCITIRLLYLYSYFCNLSATILISLIMYLISMSEFLGWQDIENMFIDKWKAKQSFTESEIKELLDLAITIYEMASEDKNIEKMKEYATYIRNFQSMLGMELRSFPELGIK